MLTFDRFPTAVIVQFNLNSEIGGSFEKAMSCGISGVHCGNTTSPKLDFVPATSREADRNQFPPGSHDFQFRNSGSIFVAAEPADTPLTSF